MPLLTSISICLLVLEADSFSGLSLQSPRLAVESCELVAWPESMDYSVEKASKGIMSSFTSGEGLVCRFRGPGVVYIQTRNLGAFEDWIRSIAPSGRSSSHSSTASSVLSLFDSDD